MHKNAPVSDKRIKKILGGSTAPSPISFPTREGDTLSPDVNLLNAFGASILVHSALGVPVPFHLRLEHWSKDRQNPHFGGLNRHFKQIC